MNAYLKPTIFKIKSLDTHGYTQYALPVLSNMSCNFYPAIQTGADFFELGGGNCVGMSFPVRCTADYSAPNADLEGGSATIVVDNVMFSLIAGTIGPKTIPTAQSVAITGPTNGTITFEFCEPVSDSNVSGIAQLHLTIISAHGQNSNTVDGELNIP